MSQKSKEKKPLPLINLLTRRPNPPAPASASIFQLNQLFSLLIKQAKGNKALRPLPALAKALATKAPLEERPSPIKQWDSLAAAKFLDKQKFPTPSTSDSSTEFQIGRWSPEEQARFIDGLLKHGKDWQKVQQVVRTRSQKIIISYSQKFLARLNRYLDGKKVIPGMTKELAFTLREILTCKIHRSTKERLEREAEIANLKARGQIFRVHKVKRAKEAKHPFEVREPKQELSPAKVDEPKEPEEEVGQYEEWKQELEKPDPDSSSFHDSLGKSIKILNIGTPIRFEVPSITNKIQQAMDVDSDCASADSGDHHKYFVENDFLRFNDKEMDKAVMDKVVEDFKLLGDLKSAREKVQVIFRLEDGKEFDVFGRQSVQHFLTQVSRGDAVVKLVQQNYPNLRNWVNYQMAKKMDRLDEEEPSSYPLWDYLKALNKEELQQFLKSKTSVYYKYINQTA